MHVLVTQPELTSLAKFVCLTILSQALAYPCLASLAPLSHFICFRVNKKISLDTRQMSVGRVRLMITRPRLVNCEQYPFLLVVINVGRTSNTLLCN